MTLIYADDAAYLVEDEPQRYAFGDPAAPLLVLNAADDLGVMWVCEEPDGWDAPAASTPLDERPDGHGGYAGETTYEPRVLAFTGSAEAPTPREARRARERLLRAITADLAGQVRYTHLDDDPARSLWVRIDGKPRVQITAGRWIDYAFVMVAEDPVKIGDEATYGPTHLPSGQGLPGLVLPLTNPLTLGGGTVTREAVVVPNDGDEPAHALYRITGPVPQPRVEVASGEFLGLRLDLGALDVAEVDTDAGTVTVNGVNRYDTWAAGSTFPLIPPGGAEVRLRSAAGGDDPAAALTITTAPRYR